MATERPESPAFVPRQLVDDLLWVVNTPSFVNGSLVALAPWLSPDVVDAEHLHAFMSARQSHRVGRHFEGVVEFWLRHVLGYEMTSCGLQIRDGNRTIGELDFVFRDEDGVLTHWEVASKFYLHHADREGSHYPGPNSTDDFERKIETLFRRQLELSRTAMPEVKARAAFVRGIVFYHPAVAAPAVLPDRMATDHVRGVWLRSSELALLDSWGSAVATIAEKPHWFAPVAQPDQLELPRLIDALDQHFETSQRARMVSIADGSSGEEVSRLCVVHDSWDR